jgi:hypothetical protein
MEGCWSPGRAGPCRHKLPCVGQGLVATSCARVGMGGRAAGVRGAARRSDSVMLGCVGRCSDGAGWVLIWKARGRGGDHTSE